MAERLLQPRGGAPVLPGERRAERAAALAIEADDGRALGREAGGDDGASASELAVAHVLRGRAERFEQRARVVLDPVGAGTVRGDRAVGDRDLASDGIVQRGAARPAAEVEREIQPGGFAGRQEFATDGTQFAGEPIEIVAPPAHHFRRLSSYAASRALTSIVST